MPDDQATEKHTVANAWNYAKSTPDKIVYWVVGFLCIYAFIRSIAAAAIKPFFFDELITLVVAAQPNATDIWKSLAQSVDSHPPLFYLLERVTLQLVTNKHIALRLLPIVGFSLTLICIFAYLRRKNTALVGSDTRFVDESLSHLCDRRAGVQHGDSVHCLRSRQLSTAALCFLDRTVGI
jgi:hypothetical protein